tara:strand:- start:818 stop:1312 length:495 start_codon:yes stop_codon:yes gene_type:complete
MIKSNELRVGNIVQRNGDWELEKEGFHTIIAINSSTSLDGTFDSVRTDVTGQDFLFTTQIEGIPITEEVLLYFGFKKPSNTIELVRYDRKEYNERVTLELVFEDLDCIEICTTTDKIDSEGNQVDIIDCTFIKLPHVKYVHQLQNLYFALTGEELPIEQAIENL